MPTFVDFDGLNINGVTDYVVEGQMDDEDSPYGLTLTERARANQPPVIDGRVLAGRPMPFTVLLRPGSSTPYYTFDQNVRRYFTPKAGLRTLTATIINDTIAAAIAVDITDFRQVGIGQYKGTFYAAEIYWRSTSVTTSAASPLTVAGNVPGLPVISITGTTTTVQRRPVTITDRTTRGLSNYIVQITFNSTGQGATANTHYCVFFQGRSVPFYVDAPNNAATRIYARVDVPASGAVVLQVYYGSSLANTVTNDKLEKAGMDLASATFTNDKWEWNKPFAISTAPRGAAGAWVAAKVGASAGTINTETDTDLRIDYAATASSEPDGFTCVVPAGAGTTNALTNLSRDDVGTFSGNVYVKKRIAGQLNWTTIEAKNGGAANTGALDVDNAVQLGIWAEGAGSYAEWTLAGGANLGLALDTNLTPTVSVGAAVAARYLDAALTVSTTGASIDFDQVFFDDVAAQIVIDTRLQQITNVSGPLLSSGAGITFSDADAWLPLPVGSVAWANATNSTASFSYAARYASG